MPVFRTVWHRLYVAVATLSWWVLAGCFAVHAAGCYIGLFAAGETKLTGDPAAFLYFYMTTATTVGYGDLSPATAEVSVIGALLVPMGSILLFTAFLGKAVAGMSALWRRRLQGLGDFSDRHGHALVVGWQGARTRTLTKGLLRGIGRAA